MIDTTPVLGKGVVKDTHNLLADGIVKLVKALAAAEGESASVWGVEHDVSRYFPIANDCDKATGITEGNPELFCNGHLGSVKVVRKMQGKARIRCD